VNPVKGVFTDKSTSLSFEFEFHGEKPNNKFVDIVIEMLVQGGYRHFFTVKSRAESHKSQIITNQIKELQKDTIFRNYTYMVPKLLVRLRSMLIYAKGLETRDIFRTQGATWEVQSLTTHVQKGTYYVCSDPHAIATCLKLYLRSLPPIFAKVPVNSIIGLEGLEDLKECGLDINEIDLIAWVIDLMALITLSEGTGMNIRAIGNYEN
jgi:hypothetical protein